MEKKGKSTKSPVGCWNECPVNSAGSGTINHRLILRICRSLISYFEVIGCYCQSVINFFYQSRDWLTFSSVDSQGRYRPRTGIGRGTFGVPTAYLWYGLKWRVLLSYPCVVLCCNMELQFCIQFSKTEFQRTTFVREKRQVKKCFKSNAI